MKRYLFLGIAAATLIGQAAAYAAPQYMTTRQAVAINSASNISDVDPQIQKLQAEVQTLQAKLQRIVYIHRSHQQYIEAEVQSIGSGG
jgi:peptidoglycan hydrolase CwlO-like protein